jgi:hypothetical protein
MVFANRELVLAPTPHGPAPLAVFDLADAHARALADALAYHRRVQFAGALDADGALALRDASAVGELFSELAPAERHVIRLDAQQAALAAHAAAFYVAERDGESYQSPEERDRLAALGELSEPLRDLLADLRLAAERLDEQALAA